MLNKIKDNIDSIHEEDTTDKEIVHAPIFDEQIKSANADVEPTQQIHQIKVTNVLETEFL